MTVQVNFGDQLSVWRFPGYYTLGLITTDDLVVAVTKVGRICYQAEDWGNLGGKPNHFGNTTWRRGRVWQ